LEEEIRGHLEMAARDREARGESPTEAAYAARREFGNTSLVKEVTRQMWASAWLDDLVQDLRLALRSLRRTPAFTVTVVTLLGLGLGGAAGMYGILDRLLLRAPEHVADPGRLYTIYLTHPSIGHDITRMDVTWREFGLLTDGIGAISSAAVYSMPGNHDVSSGAQQAKARTAMASAGYFGALGVYPALGRFFFPEDSAAGAPQVAVIGYGFWQRWFGGAHDVAGKTISWDRMAYTIIGVAPRGFSGPSPDRVDVWLPAQQAAPAVLGSDWREHGSLWRIVARLKSNRTAAQAVAEGFIHLKAAPLDPRRYGVRSYTTAQAGSILPGRALTDPTSGMRLSYVVAGVTALVALIALANAAGLLLLRALRRERETAVRLVLGVSRGRLLLATAVESVMLAVLGGAAACAVAAIGGELLRKLILRVDWAAAVVDARVFGLILTASVVIGFLIGLVPGWLAGRPEAVAAIKSGGRGGEIRRGAARRTLLVLQGALSVALLAGLALFVRSFERARAFDFGPDVDHVLVAELQQRTPGFGFPGTVGPAVYREAADRVAALPGVAVVGVGSSTPLWSQGIVPLRADGVDSVGRFQTSVSRGPYLAEVTPNYFSATGLRLVRGRLFADNGPGGPREAIVSEEMARLFWPRANPLGKCLFVGHKTTDCTQVVGVVRNVTWTLQDSASLAYYIPLSQAVSGEGGSNLIVRAVHPERLVSAVRSIVASVAGIRSPVVITLRGAVDPQYRRLRQGLTLFGVFAGLAVVVAMIGLYSLVAYSVTQRAHEFGIRVALGARVSNLVQLVLGQALGYAAAGLLLGLVLAVLGGRYIAPLLYRTSPRDPLALCAAASVLVVAALVACIVPARAAARADPRQALQAE
jgi:predicted permease